MIGFTKLLCGTATVSRALRQTTGAERREPDLLQFTTADRPLVVWNTTTRCNLRCRHCYNDSRRTAHRHELTTDEARTLIDDLAQMQVPVLLFSGGEPVLRDDLCQLAAYASRHGIRPVLSTNGTLITGQVAERLREAGFQYVGVSIDGLAEVHDQFRRLPGAFDAAWNGIRRARQAGLRTGARFTVTTDNVDDLPKVLDKAVEENVDRFCLYHLVYSGRGTDLAARDLTPAHRRSLMQWLAARTEELHRAGRRIEILTTDNHADGVFLCRLIADRDPDRAREVLDLLAMHGGCSAGRKFANVDALGEVHACQFWGHHSLGNVRERPFSSIWTDMHDALLCQLKSPERHLKGRCGRCAYRAYCGGCRIRAGVARGDMWEADPACYLTDEEVGSHELEGMEPEVTRVGRER